MGIFNTHRPSLRFFFYVCSFESAYLYGTLNITCERCRELNEIIPDGTDKIEKCMACGAYLVDVRESLEPSRDGGNATKQTDANTLQKKSSPG